MIGLAICSALLWLLSLVVLRNERRIRIWLKRTEEKVELGPGGQKAIIDACDMIMDLYEHDPQSAEYRNAMETKLYLERKTRDIRKGDDDDKE